MLNFARENEIEDWIPDKKEAFKYERPWLTDTLRTLKPLAWAKFKADAVAVSNGEKDKHKGGFIETNLHVAEKLKKSTFQPSQKGRGIFSNTTAEKRAMKIIGVESKETQRLFIEQNMTIQTRDW